MDDITISHAQIASNKPLSRDEQMRLAVLFRRCILARQRIQAESLPIIQGRWACPVHETLVLSLTRLAIKEATGFCREYNLLSEQAELESCAIHGLLESLTRFEPARGIAPSTYVTYGIRFRLRRYVATERQLIRVHDKAWTGPYAEQAKAAQNIVGETYLESLAAPSILDQLADEEERKNRRESMSAMMDEALDRLDGRERSIIVARIAGRTLEDVGGDHGISKERCRQIELRALRKSGLPIASIYQVRGRKKEKPVLT